MFRPSHVQSHLLLQKAGKSRAGTERAGGGGLVTINLNQHITPSVNIFWRLHSALHCRRHSVLYMAQCPLPHH